MIPQDAHTVAAAAVAGVFLYLGAAGLAIRAATLRGLPSWVGVALGVFAAPLSAPVLLVMAMTHPDPVLEARGGGVFKRGPDGIVSLPGILIGAVLSLVALVGTFVGWRYGFEIRGENLQAPVVRAFMIGGFIAGFLVSTLSKRVSFLEALIITGLCALVPVFGGDYVSEMFTYGTAAAYYGVVLVAGALLLLLVLTLGGSFGFLFTGDGKISLSWSYENWIGRRFLMGKRGNNVVGTITSISVLAVAVGTCAMIVVMSVMNGFSTDLRSKIFGANAHLIVLKYGNDFTDYDAVRKKTRRVDHVTGASPFILNEVMVSSDVNLTGALLKGIDTETVDQVSILRKNVVQGDLNHLRTPALIAVPKTHKIKPTVGPAGTQGSAPLPSGQDDKKAMAPTGTTRHDVADPLSPTDPLLPPLEQKAADAEAANTPTTSELEALDAAIAAAAAGTPAADALAKDGGPADKNLLPGIAIGQEMSRNLKVYVGDVINVVSPVGELGPTGPVPKARAFRVAAVFFSGMYEYDSKFIYIDLAEAQDFFTLGQSVTGIEYKVDDIDKTQEIGRHILKRVGGYPYRSKDWMEMNKNLFSALKLEKIAMFIILTFIILVASFLIAATLIVFVIEKSKEIAILKSMGATDTSIMKVFVTYGVIVGTFGALAGLGVGLLLCFGIQTFGIGLDPDVYYITNLPVHVDSFEATVVALAAIVLSYLATIYPSLLAARLRPVEGLRFE